MMPPPLPDCSGGIPWAFSNWKVRPKRSLQSRLQADRFEDIVASVALIRPGPIKGNMVDPFIARRRGREEVTYIHPQTGKILAPTYGVVLYQEQVIEIATEIAGFTPGEADRLRKVMTKFRSQTEMESIGREFIQKALTQGVDEETAEVIFSYIVGYAGYGFCEAHAAAFADTAYRTAYLLEHHPAHFYAALLNAQPMGFYPPTPSACRRAAGGWRSCPCTSTRALRISLQRKTPSASASNRLPAWKHLFWNPSSQERAKGSSAPCRTLSAAPM